MTMLFPGNVLRARREELGLNYQDVFRATRIPIEHLKALEAGNIEALPGPTYVLGFIQTYCECLDLNPHLYMDRYRGCIQNANPQSPPRTVVSTLTTTYRSPNQRPAWLSEMITWGSICAVLLLAWLTYAVMVRPFASLPQDAVDAAPDVPAEIAPPEHHFVEDY